MRPSPALGVTTAVIGNCGFTIAPCRPADRELHDAQPDAGRGHVARRAARRASPGSFETFAEYLAQLRARGSAVNLAAYVGHSSVRTWVMGDDAARREASAAEIAQMAGGRARRDGRTAPSASPAAPARRTTAKAACRCRRGWRATPSMVALIEAMGEGGRGVYMVTKGGHTPVALLEEIAARSRPAGDDRRAAAQQHRRRARCSTTSTRSPPPTRAAIALLGQVSCCPLTMDFTLASPYPVEGPGELEAGAGAEPARR